MPFAAMAVRTDRPLLHAGAVVSMSCVQINILSRWIPRYMKRFARSTTVPSNVTAGIALRAALLTRVHHSVHMPLCME